MPSIALRPPPWLARPLPGELAVSEFPSAVPRPDFAQPGGQAIYPCELHENLAQNGIACGPWLGAPHRHVELDHFKTEAAAQGCRHQAGGERDGIASAAFSSRSYFKSITASCHRSRQPGCRLRSDRIAGPPRTRLHAPGHFTSRRPGGDRNRQPTRN